MYSSKIIKFKNEQAVYVDYPVNDGETTKEALWRAAKEEGATVMVVAMHGRKGPKEDLTVAGTAVQYLAENAELPVIIIKDAKTR